LTRGALWLEQLQPRCLLAADLCNPFNPLDVNDDGWVTSSDALVVINELQSRSAAASSSRAAPAAQFTDANADGSLGPLDALVVINHLLDFAGSYPALVFGVSPQNDPDGNGVVLRSVVTLAGQSVPHGKIRVMLGGEPPLLTRAPRGGFNCQWNFRPGGHPCGSRLSTRSSAAVWRRASFATATWCWIGMPPC